MTQTVSHRSQRRNYLNENRSPIVVFDLLIISFPISAPIIDRVASIVPRDALENSFCFSVFSIEIPSNRFERRRGDREHAAGAFDKSSRAATSRPRPEKKPKKKSEWGCSHEEWSDSLANTSSTAARMMDLIVGSFDILVRRVRKKSSHRNKNKSRRKKRRKKAIADRFIDENSIQSFVLALTGSILKRRALWRSKNPLMPARLSQLLCNFYGPTERFLLSSTSRIATTFHR